MVLFFYPLDFTFVCPTEITAFSDKHGEFAKTNAEVNMDMRLASPASIARGLTTVLLQILMLMTHRR